MADVTVGCKLPHGLILSQGGKRVTLNGANASRIVGGFGMTSVNGELIRAWLAEHKDFQPVKSGLIFIQESENRASSEAKEKAEVKSGFEGVDPEKPGPGIKPEGKVTRKKSKK